MERVSGTSLSWNEMDYSHRTAPVCPVNAALLVEIAANHHRKMARGMLYRYSNECYKDMKDYVHHVHI
jgi:hypothetical protein